MKTIKKIITGLVGLIAFAVVILVLWTQVKIWIYELGFRGNDTPQFIHYVYYQFNHPHFPINAWDHLWHNGAPRMLDATWINFVFIRPLVEAVGFYKAIKIYPVLSYLVFAFFSYLLFWELSGSFIIALGLAVSLVLSQGLYNALYSAGVVLSSISQALTPLQLYFIARFVKRKKKLNLYLAGVASAFGFFFHGMMMMFMGFIVSFVTLLFTSNKGEFLISKKSLKNAFTFAVIALSVGAVACWPHLRQAFEGGSNSTLIPVVGAPTIGKLPMFYPMFDLSNRGVALVYIISTLFLLVFWKKGLLRLSLPFIALTVYFIFWCLTFSLGVNPIAGIIFPGRFMWMWPLSLGSLAALFLSPLSEPAPQKLKNWLKAVRWLGFGLVKIIVLVVAVSSLWYPFKTGQLYSYFKPEDWETFDITEFSRQSLGYVYDQVDHQNLNARFWTHLAPINTEWARVSDVPLSEGYFHFWTKRSRLWEGWTYAVLAYPNWESQEIPTSMAEPQALFFLDWYGIKHLAFGYDSKGEWDLAPYLTENPDYQVESKTNLEKGFITLKPDLTSKIISAANSPVIGFIGNDDSYMTFVKDLGMLGLNSKRVIPLRLAESPSKVKQKTLEQLDGVVIYGFKNSLLSSAGWDKIEKFAEAGGKVWIETGGESPEREGDFLPGVFPIKSTSYGDLGQSWLPGGELAGRVDFNSLEPLAYRGTPWKISYTSPEGIRENARVLLSQSGNPVAVVQSKGRGKVLWTGVNFWYRPEEYRQNGREEAVFISLFLKELFGELLPTPAEFQAERVSPEKAIVTGQGFNGVIFRENLWPGWQATVEVNGRRQKLKIYPAGPEMMYASVKGISDSPLRVEFTFRGDPFHWLSLVVSLVSLVVLLLWIIMGERLLPGFLKKDENEKRTVSRKIASWWDSEEN